LYLVGFFFVICAMMHGSTNIKLIGVIKASRGVCKIQEGGEMQKCCSVKYVVL